MSFRKNESQQMRIDDPLYGMSERKLRMLKGSWAESFAEHVFPNIPEEPFAVLYSANDASKPNTPVNVTLGQEILKAMFDLTDEDLLHNTHFNFMYQYALHTTSFEEQPINDNTLTRFRRRVREYEELTGIDLVKAAFDILVGRMSKEMDLDPSFKRMDSAMISAGCRRLSRLGIMDETLRLAARRIARGGAATDLTKKYYDEDGGGGGRDPGYRLKSGEVAAKMGEMLRDALAMLDACPAELAGDADIGNLRRMVDDQSRMAEDGRVLKAGAEILPDSMQTPHDPDATYRKKNEKGYVGFVANVVEACDGEKNLVTDYDLRRNTYSDAQFGEDALGAMPDGGGTAVVAVDGAYVSAGVLGLAEGKGISVVSPTALGGFGGTFVTRFEFGPEGTMARCPAGHAPIDAKHVNGNHLAHFDKDTCLACPHNGECPGKYRKNTALTKFSDTALTMAWHELRMGTPGNKELAKKRNGVEGIPSVLRRKYGVDRLRAKGLVRKRHRLGFIMMAINARRLMKWLEKGGKTPQKTPFSSAGFVFFTIFFDIINFFSKTRAGTPRFRAQAYS